MTIMDDIRLLLTFNCQIGPPLLSGLSLPKGLKFEKLTFYYFYTLPD